MADSCALARQRLAKKVASLREAGGVEKATKLVKTGFLLNAVTSLKNAASNTLSLGFRTLAEHPVRAGVDYVLALGRSAKDGKFSMSPDEYRQVKFALDTDGFKKLTSGFRQGMQPMIDAAREGIGAARASKNPWEAVRNGVAKFGDELNVRLDAEGVNRTLEYKETTYKSPMVNAMVNATMGVMEGADRPFWRAMHDFSVHQQSYVLAAAEGLKGDAFKQRAQQLFEKPTDEMALRAQLDANYSTFKNKNILSRMASGLKQSVANAADEAIPASSKGVDRFQRETKKAGAKVGSYVLETNLPFTGVPSSIAGQAFSLATGPLSLVRLLTNKDPAVTSRIISDAMIGTGLIAAGYALSRDGNLTGAAPQAGTSERALWDAQGKQAWSVRIGGKWHDTRFAVPVAAPLYAGAALAKAKGQSASEKGISAVGTTAQMLTQQTYLQNVKAMIDALNAPDQKGARLLTSQVPIPSLVGQIARATDPMERKPEGILGQLAVRFPWLSKTQPPSVDALGHVATRTPLERVSEIVSPSRIKESTETPLTQEIARVGAKLTMPSSKVTIGGRQIQRTPHEQADFLQQAGPAIEGWMNRVIESDGYKALPIDKQADVLEKIAGEVRTAREKADAIERIKGGQKTTPTKKPRVLSAAGQKLLDAGVQPVYAYDKDGRITGATLRRAYQEEAS